MAADTRSYKRPAIDAYVPQLVIVVLGALLLWNCRYSLCHSDEAFYLAVAHRFWMGDRILLDEWHIAQFYVPIFLPAYRLYRALVPSGDGVYLFFRVLYVLFAMVSPLMLLAQAKRDRLPKSLAVVAAALLLLYARANIKGPSYYGLCLHFLLIAVLLVYVPGPGTDAGADGRRHALTASRARQLLAGVSFALSCICCPPMVLFLPAFLLLVHVVDPCGMRLVVTGGFGFVALYVLPILTQGPVAETLAAIRRVLGDPEHQQSMLDDILKVGYYWVRYVNLMVVPLTVAAVVVELRSYALGKQDGLAYRRWMAVYPLLVVLMLLLTVRKTLTGICFVVSVPAGMLLMPAVVHSYLTRKEPLPFGVALYLVGIVLAIAFFLSSNTGLDALTIGFAVGTAGGLLCWAERLRDVRGQRAVRDGDALLWVQVVGLAIACTILVVSFAAHRFLGTYRDAPVQRMTAAVQEGPAAGLLTTPEHRDAYMAVLDALRVADEDDAEGGLLVSRLLPWAYLASERPCSTLSVWQILLSDTRLIPYYETEGYEFPRMVLVADPQVGGFETAPFNDHKGYRDFNFNEYEGPFYDWLMANSEVLVSNEYATVYRVNDEVFAQE